jgi:phosphomannomutase
MATIYLFDVDGTLTPPKNNVDPRFAKQFLKWMKEKEVYIVSGGSFVRILDQLGSKIVNHTAGIFACMGNIFYEQIDQINREGFDEWRIVYENSFKAPPGLYKDLDLIVHNSPYEIKTGKHYERRTGMINFSVVGRNADPSQRADYAAYDAQEHEREHIVEQLKEKYDKLDFVIGGAVSIDIFNVGNDKSQVIERHFEEALRSNRIVFVGDRIPFPGNDYSLATALLQSSNGEVYEVESWQDTAELLKTEAFA